MQDFQAKIEKLLLEAEDCELIAKLATDVKKRAHFARLSVRLKALAREMQSAVVEHAKTNDTDAA
jgi:outer membrane murein-binding lipoprotein Lpp